MRVAKTFFESEVVRLADLAIVRQILDGYEFRDCLLMGPAVVVMMDNITLNDCNLGGPDLPALFWLIEENRENIVGAIGFTNSTFEGCQFQMVGFAGKEDLRAKLTADLEQGQA